MQTVMKYCTEKELPFQNSPYFFASSFFGSSSRGVDFKRKSLAARSIKVPPHFNPRDCSSDFNLSKPRTCQDHSNGKGIINNPWPMLMPNRWRGSEALGAITQLCWYIFLNFSHIKFLVIHKKWKTLLYHHRAIQLL